MVAVAVHIDAGDAFASEDALERIVAQIRAVWPQVRIILRGDSGFCRDEIMSWSEATHEVDYVLGLLSHAP